MSVNQTRRRLTVPVSKIIVIVIVVAALALVLLGILVRSRPAHWPGQIGDFIPGWPWW